MRHSVEGLCVVIYVPLRHMPSFANLCIHSGAKWTRSITASAYLRAQHVNTHFIIVAKSVISESLTFAFFSSSPKQQEIFYGKQTNQKLVKMSNVFCSICLDIICTDKPTVGIKCGHIYHEICMKKWTNT